jgi:hypothetical protein
MALTAATSRMKKEEAVSALTAVEAQLVTHRGLCELCVQARAAKTLRATSWATWTPCSDQRELLQTKLQLEHRLTYLRRQATTAAARAAGMTVSEFMRKHADDYRAIVREYGDI